MIPSIYSNLLLTLQDNQIFFGSGIVSYTSWKCIFWPIFKKKNQKLILSDVSNKKKNLIKLNFCQNV